MKTGCSDLWSIFDFIMPGYLYDYKQFKNTLELPVVKYDDEFAAKRLKQMVSPFILRRKKSEVLTDLPEKIEEAVYTRLTGEQRQLYDAHVSHIYKELAGQSEEDFQSRQMEYMAELTRLRQLCCAPRLCYENYEGPDAKLDLCLELVKDAVDGGHRLLLFSQFTSMLDILDASFKQLNIPTLYLSGKSTKEQRRQMVEAFAQGNIPVFLISLKAGGTGLKSYGGRHGHPL